MYTKTKQNKYPSQVNKLIAGKDDHTEYRKLYMMNPLTVSIDLFVYRVKSPFPVSIDMKWPDSS